VKRLYFLLAIASLQIIVGSITILDAAQPVRMDQDVFVPSGAYYHFEFGILGTGRLSANVSEILGRSFTLFVFEDRGYASFRDGSLNVPPLLERDGTRILFDLDLPGSGQYHVVAVDFPAREELRVHFELVAVGLKPSGTIIAVIILVGGLALVGASLILSVWSWRRALAAPAARAVADASPDPPSDPSPNSSSGAQEPAPDPPDDNTRIY
jgi:hypothetical protein